MLYDFFDRIRWFRNVLYDLMWADQAFQDSLGPNCF